MAHAPIVDTHQFHLIDGAVDVDSAGATISLSSPAEAGRVISLSDSQSPSVLVTRDTHSTSTSPTSSLTDYFRYLMKPHQDHHHELMDKLVARGRVTRIMDKEAIAGTAVGVVLAVALLTFCLYPVVVHRLNKRKRHAERFHPDTEVAINPGADPLHGPIRHRRLSSSDSIKQRGCQPTRGDAGPGEEGGVNPWPGMDRGCGGAHDGVCCTGAQAHVRQGPPGVYYDGSQPLTIESASPPNFEYYAGPFPSLHAEGSPESGPAAIPPNQIVLKGNNEDYYSPSIPSEAFGMYATLEPQANIVPPTQPPSRGTSLTYSVKQLFQRKSSRDHTLTSVRSTSYAEDHMQGAAHLQGATPLQRIISTEDSVESPVDISYRGVSFLATTRAVVDSIDTSHAAPRELVNQSPYGSAGGHFKNCPSPPRQPAPGTVNPMDIMPASTETEVWHRTDYQLFTASSQDGSPGRSNSGDVLEANNVQEDESSSTVADETPSPPAQLPESATPTKPTKATTNDGKKKKKEESKAGEASSQPHLPSASSLPVRINYIGQNTGHSEQTTSQRIAVSSASSAQNTPSTQIDTPSPESESLGSSDYRHSASPQSGLESGIGVSSPRGGIYKCDEPGCNQVFDQPHKLKHHQRYHSKDHKCPYPTCGKGFGTKTHLQRHINDRHEKKKKFHCAIQGCDYSRQGGKAFPRKDNWKRHMTKIHNMDHHSLPEPVEVDQDMTGT